MRKPSVLALDLSVTGTDIAADDSLETSDVSGAPADPTTSSTTLITGRSTRRSTSRSPPGNAGVRLSFGSVGDAYDNAAIESF